MQIGDLSDRRGDAEELDKARRLVNQRTVRPVGVLGELLHRVVVNLLCWRGAVEQCRFQGRRRQRFKISPADFGVGVLTADHFSLLCDADLSRHTSRRLGEDRFVTGPTAAAHGTTATMEKPQFDSVAA